MILRRFFRGRWIVLLILKLFFLVVYDLILLVSLLLDYVVKLSTNQLVLLKFSHQFVTITAVIWQSLQVQILRDRSLQVGDNLGGELESAL